MGVLDRLRDRFGQRVTVTLAPSVPHVLDMEVDRLYATQPNLRSVVTFVAANVAQLPLKCYERVDDGDRRRDVDGVAPRLFSAPNATQTQYELFYRTVLDLKLYGRAYWCLVADTSSSSGWQLRPIPPSWVVDHRGQDPFAPETLVLTTKEGGRVEADASDFVIFSEPDVTDPRMGCSPVDALKQVLSEQISAYAYREQVWANGGRMSAYISRPKDVQPWKEGQGERFAQQFRAAWTGNSGSRAGGMPVLEDGMEIKSLEFNAREAQWAEAAKLSREDVAGIYHVNPAMVWSNDGQTYASVKENARQLYVETLGPDLRMLTDRINRFVLPKIGAPSDEYAEFDLQAKLAGSFEEQAAQLQTSVGAPWMTRNEARGRMNLPRIEDGDAIVTPLNVITGGLASPTDTAKMMAALAKSGDADVPEEARDLDEPDLTDSCEKPRKARSHTEAMSATELSKTIRKFFKRQRNAVLPRIGAAKAKAAEDPSWWDAERWDSELADDLAPVLLAQTTKAGRDALRQLDLDPDEYDEPVTENYVKKVAAGKAHGINSATLSALMAAIDSDPDSEAIGSTPAGVFDIAEDDRADSLGLGCAAFAAGWGLMEATRQTNAVNVMKTWIVTNPNPRASHAAMDGETVPRDEPFSNGAMWPHDENLDADETCGCDCEVEVSW